jgi:bacterioferritin
MKSDAKVIAELNQILKAELTAINQYFLHAEMCENWGYERMAKHTRKESIEEMTHAEKLTERILLLDGAPNPPVTNDTFPLPVRCARVRSWPLLRRENTAACNAR